MFISGGKAAVQLGLAVRTVPFGLALILGLGEHRPSAAIFYRFSITANGFREALRTVAVIEPEHQAECWTHITTHLNLAQMLGFSNLRQCIHRCRQTVISDGWTFILPLWREEKSDLLECSRKTERFRRGLLALLFVFLPLTPPVWSAELVGDGQADDTEALQQLIDSQGAVQLKKGRYRLTKTVFVDLSKTGYASVSGDGTAQLIMSGAGPALHFIGSHGGTADPKTVKPEVWNQQRSPMVSGIEVIGNHPEADGLEFTGVMQVTMDRVLVRKCRHAVHLTKRNRNIVLTGCHLYHNTGIGVFYDNVDLHQSNITGCHISYNGGGGVVAIGGAVRNLQIGTCDIEANQSEESPSSANVLLDSTGGSIAEVTITGCTLQHTHKISGSANIRIFGAGNDANVFRLAGNAHTYEGNITITGNVLSDVDVNLEIKNARGVTISANTFWEGFAHDLVIEDSSNIVVVGNNLDRNPRYLVNGFALAERNGVLINRVKDSSFSNNIVSGVWRKEAAVDINECLRLQISNNSVLDSDGIALRLKRSKRCVVIGNMLRDDRPDGEKSQSVSLEVDGEDNLIGPNQLGRG